MKIYNIRSKPVPWGDYGHILLNGMAHQNYKTKIVEVERTGPFIPKFSFPSLQPIIITGKVFKKLNNSNLKGLIFKEAVFKKVVKLDWHTWDFNSGEPQRYPSGGEPENYIEKRKNSDNLLKEMPNIYSIGFQEVGIILNPDSNKIDLINWQSYDFFRFKNYGFKFISEKAKNWLEQEYPEEVSFEEYEINF